MIVQTKYVTKYNEPPARPEPLRFTRTIEPPLILTMQGVHEMLKQIEDGDRSPFAHICITQEDNESAKQNNDKKNAWIKQAQKFINEVWKRYDEAMLKQVAGNSTP